MALEEIAVGAVEGLSNAKKFNLESNIVAWHYFQHLPKIRIPNLNKISILLTNSDTNHSFLPNSKGSEVCLYERFFNFDNFFQLDPLERRKVILEVIIDSIRKISEKLNWDITPFEEVYEKLVASNLEIRYPLTKVTSAKNKKYKASLEVEFLTEYAVLSLILLDKNSSFLKKIEIVKIQPHKMYLYRIGGIGKWISDNEYLMSNGFGDINYKINVDTNDLSLIFDTSRRSEQELIEEVKICSAEGSDQEKLELIKKRLERLMSNDKGLN